MFDRQFWQEGVAGSANIVTYNGEDVRGVAFVEDSKTRAMLISAHNLVVRSILLADNHTPEQAPHLPAARPKLVLALPDYEDRTILIGSDEVINGERLVCVAIKDALPAKPPAQDVLTDEQCDRLIAREWSVSLSMQEYLRAIVRAAHLATKQGE